MPGERLELSNLAVHDFESCAVTNFATPALSNRLYNKKAVHSIPENEANPRS